MQPKMPNDKPTSRFFSATMARLYADQGYLRKAAQVYRYLVQQAPDRMDLRRELAVVEEEIRLQTHPTQKELGLLMQDWAALMRKQQQSKRDRTDQQGGDDEQQGNGVEA
jgi:hypothetical protein